MDNKGTIFVFFLTIMLTILKTSGVVSISWLVVSLPILIPAIFIGLILFSAFIVAIVILIKEELNDNKDNE